MSSFLGSPSFFSSPDTRNRKKIFGQQLPNKVQNNAGENCLDEIFVQEVSACQCNPNVKELKKRVKMLQKDMKTMSAHMQKTELSKIELANKCNTLEAHVASCARDVISLNNAREKCKKMNEERAEMELAFMNQLSDLSTTMRRKEMEHEGKMREKDDTISMLQTKLSAYKIMSSDGEAVVDQSNNPTRSPITPQIEQNHNNDGLEGNDNDDTNHLSNTLAEYRQKNSTLSTEIQDLYTKVNELEIKATRLPEVEKQLKESNELLSTYKRANSLLSLIDDEQENNLRQEFEGSNRENESFMNQLESLENDMSADLKELESELLTSTGELHEI